jgi:hypothetical protein
MVVQTKVVASTIWAPNQTSIAPSVNPLGVSTGDLSGATSVVISDPLPVDLFVYRGDSGRFRVTVTDSVTGDPLNISAATWDCDIRSSHDAQTVIVSLTVNEIDANTVEVVLEPLASSLLIDQSVWDLEMTLNGEVQTLLAGVVHVHKDVSRQ